MGLSPSSKRAELIREISRDISRSAGRKASSSQGSTSVDGQYDTDTGASFDAENAAVQLPSKQLEGNNNNKNNPFGTASTSLSNLPSPESRYERYQTPASELKVESPEFEHLALEKSPQMGTSDDDEESVSVEIARGGRKSADSTPTWSRQQRGMAGKAIDGSDVYNMLGQGNRKTQRGSDGLSRKTSQNATKDNPGKNLSYNSVSQRRTNLADMHAKIVTQDGLGYDDRPSSNALPVKSTRFGSSKLRQVSTNAEAAASASASARGGRPSGRNSNPAGPSAVVTPQKRTKSAMPNAVPGSAFTQHSFMLPDLPDLTELVSGTRRDGTPVFSRSAKARSRFAGLPNSDRNGGGGSRAAVNHIPIESVPIPADEKAIFASLQLLREKVTELELYKVEADKKLDDCERENFELRAELNARERMYRDDFESKSGGYEDNNKGRTVWRTDKLRLESTVQSLQSRLDRAERKESVAAIETKRIEKERDNLATQLGAAYYSHEELKRENEALQLENETLREEVDSLRTNREKSQKIIKQLKDEILKRVEDGEMNEPREYRETNYTTSRAREAELQDKIDRQNDTIRNLQRSTEEKANAYLREEIGRLRGQLAQHNAERNDWSEKINFKEADIRRELEQAIVEHQEESNKWTEKEARLKGKIQQTEEAVRQLQLPREKVTNPKSRGEPSRKPSRAASSYGVEKAGGEGGKRYGSEPPQSNLDTTIDIPKLRQQSHVSEMLARKTARSHPYDNAFCKIDHGVEVDDESDHNSTTDLDLSRPKTRRGAALGETSRKFETKQANNADVTLLSAMDTLEIANLRKMLEDERRSARNKSKAKGTVDDAGRDINEHTATGISRRPSLKNRSDNANDTMPTQRSKAHSTKGTQPSRANEVPDEYDTLPRADNTQHETSHSILSNTSRRRRRSAPAEPTNAFTVPDVTLDAKDADADFTTTNPPNDNANAHESDAHDPKTCTVCTPNAPIPRAVPVNEHTVPVNEHTVPEGVDVADTTMRPVQAPLQALSCVLKVLGDEVAHLRLELRVAEAEYTALDPAIGKGRRKSLHRRIGKLMDAIEARSEMVYRLHDVLEGVKGGGDDDDDIINNNKDNNNIDGAGAGGVGFAGTTVAERAAAMEREAENTLASMGFEIGNVGNLEDLRRKTMKKSVKIASVGPDSEDEEGYSGSEGDGDREEELKGRTGESLRWECL